MEETTFPLLSMPTLSHTLWSMADFLFSVRLEWSRKKFGESRVKKSEEILLTFGESRFVEIRSYQHNN